MAKIKKRNLFPVHEKPAQELKLTREGVRVRQCKKGPKVQIQAVGGEEEDLGSVLEQTISPSQLFVFLCFFFPSA